MIKPSKKTVFFILACLSFSPFAFDQRLKTVYYGVESSKISSPITIALLTDLHSCNYGEGQREILEAVDGEKPDLVLLGGDILDDVLPPENAQKVMAHLAQKYPVFYVSGNHEYWSGKIGVLKDMVRAEGIPVLEGRSIPLVLGGQRLNICGADDPTYIGKEASLGQIARARAEADFRDFTILLIHRPELFKEYKPMGFDLILSGHSHGGQWRIPKLLNGFYAPDQGFFPRYAGGLYSEGGTLMAVSRGLARESTRVPRIFNPPELLIIRLNPQK